MNEPQALSLQQLTREIGRALAQPALANVWVTAETADLRVSGGHCYMELVEKDPDTGKQLAKVRATIWASRYYALAQKFICETGRNLASDMKVMVRASVAYHQLFGLSLNITDINCAYTLGDVMRRRNMMIDRLRAEGIIDMNRLLPWPLLPQRVAIISAKGAAGYGDFINQLYTNPARLRFCSRLFPATMQGETTARSVIAALDLIAADPVPWDCVVIIRGGGASTDLLAFDDYDLAANIAQFPVPVVIGIGHERDITLLDYVANMRVKTPTAAAEWLIGRGEQQLAALQATATAMLRAVTDRIGGCQRQLSQIAGMLPLSAQGALQRARAALNGASISLQGVCDRRLAPQRTRLDALASALSQATTVAVERARTRIDSMAALIDALSPQATLRRGYSITRLGGHALRSAGDARPDEVMETVLADGSIISRIVTTDQKPDIS